LNAYRHARKVRGHTAMKGRPFVLSFVTSLEIEVPVEVRLFNESWIILKIRERLRIDTAVSPVADIVRMKLLDMDSNRYAGHGSGGGPAADSRLDDMRRISERRGQQPGEGSGESRSNHSEQPLLGPTEVSAPLLATAGRRFVDVVVRRVASHSIIQVDCKDVKV